MPKRNYYDLLGVSQDASVEQIKLSYKKRARIVHPDRFDKESQPDDWNLANEMLRDLNEAYAVLRNPNSRALYDFEINARSQTNNQNQRSESTQRSKPADQEQRSQAKPNPQEPPPKRGVKSTTFDNLPQDVKDKFLKRQSTEKSDVLKIKISGIGEKYFWVSMSAGWYPILFALSQSALWDSSVNFLLLFLTIFASLALILHGGWIWRYHRSSLKPFYYFTPLYFIKTSFDQILFCPVWEIKDIKVTHIHRNHTYQSSNVEIVLPDRAETLHMSSEAQVKNLFATLDYWRDQVKEAHAHGKTEYFKTWDDFREVKSNGKKEEKIRDQKEANSVLSYVGSAVFACLLFMAAYGFNVSYNGQERTVIQPLPSQNRVAMPSPPSLPEEPFDAAPEPLPQNGVTEYDLVDDPIAPLRIVTRSNDHYLVKVVDWDTEETAMTMFIRAGETVKVEVPLGSYKLKYAAGKTWYGDIFLFGPNTVYSEAEKRLDFVMNSNRQVSGYTIELFLQPNGNLKTKRISAKDF